MADTDNRILLDWDALEVGETFDKYEYVLTQEMITTNLRRRPKRLRLANSTDTLAS